MLLGRTLIASCLLVLLATACRHESTTNEGFSISPNAPKSTLVERGRVLLDGKVVGTVKTYRFEGSDHQYLRVLDLRDESLGYITDDGKAFRFSAHGGEELVANSTDQRRNVAAIFGTPEGNFALQIDR